MQDTPVVENSFIESFNCRLWDECLNVEVFFTLDDACEKLANSQQDYNRIRIHSALDDHAPVTFADGGMTVTGPVSQDSHELREALR